MRRAPALLLPLLLLALPAAAQPEDLDFKKLIERGDYPALAAKLRPFLDLEHADARLRAYLELNLQYLERGAKPAQPGSELILIRGAKNDKAFKMPASSGGDALMLPNSIRYMRTSWDKRLPRLEGYFREATDLMGGNGSQLQELEKIISHHKGGGLGKGANSVKSVLISASTQPLPTFGPPFYIIKVAPERAIFNWKGLQGEREVLLPFWVLPNEIVARCETMQEVLEHPLYKASKLKDVSPYSSGYGVGGGSGNNWEIIEDNIRNGRAPLEGVAGLNSFFPEGRDVGPRADADYLRRFVEKVERAGGRVEMVPPGDKRLPDGAQARTYLDPDGKPRVLLRQGESAAKIGLLDELTHVHQLAQMVRSQGKEATSEVLMRAAMGDPLAKDVVNRWEIRAKSLIRSLLPESDPAREVLSRSIESLEKELDPYTGARRRDGTLDWKGVAKQVGGGVAHFTLALFLKELAVVARTGDSLCIQEFFDGLLTTDFFVEYGLFSLGAAGADLAYAAFLEKNVARFIRPRFVQTVVRSQLALAVGMALPDLVHGRFDGRTFAINLAGLGLSSVAVQAGVQGIKWVLQLSKVSGGAELTTWLARANRLRKVTGFVYTAVETAVVLYFGEQISQAIDERLARREAEGKVRDAVAALLKDPTGDGARERADAVSDAFRAYRDLSARPLQEVEGLLLQRLHKLATEVKQGEDGLKRLKASGASPDLVARAERLAREREAGLQREMEQAVEAFDKGFAAARAKVYDPAAKADALPLDEDALWILRGKPAGEGLGQGTDWLSRLRQGYEERRVLGAISDLPDSRLAAYDREADLWAALARAHADDPEAAAYFADRASGVREVKDQDFAVVSGQRTGADRRPGDVDATLRGFIDALKQSGDGR
ncbi:MAG: hypothetical protein AB7N76_15790 [Planctomycetota bacterium]